MWSRCEEGGRDVLGSVPAVHTAMQSWALRFYVQVSSSGLTNSHFTFSIRYIFTRYIFIQYTLKSKAPPFSHSSPSCIPKTKHASTSRVCGENINVTWGNHNYTSAHCNRKPCDLGPEVFSSHEEKGMKLYPILAELLPHQPPSSIADSART